MQDTKMGSDEYIMLLAEATLLEEIRMIYEDVSITSEIRIGKRKEAMERFVKAQGKQLERLEEEIRQLVDKVIANNRWIKEIDEEELDDELEER